MEPLNENNAHLSESEQKIISTVRESQDAAEQEKNEKLDNALNAMSVGVLFDLYLLSTTPTFLIMQKMREFSSFNAFLGAAFDEKIGDFLPDILAKKESDHE